MSLLCCRSANDVLGLEDAVHSHILQLPALHHVQCAHRLDALSRMGVQLVNLFLKLHVGALVELVLGIAHAGSFAGTELNVDINLHSLHLDDLVFDSVLQSAQDPQLSVDLDLHVYDSLTQILGQVVVAVVITRINSEFLLQVVVGLFGHLVGRAVLGLVLIQEAADLLDSLQVAVVVLIQQTLDPAARWAFRAPIIICAERPLPLSGTFIASGALLHWTISPGVEFRAQSGGHKNQTETDE